MDHNLDFLKSEMHKPTATFISLNIENDLISCITRPTRITKTSATLIDNIFIDSKYQERFKSHILLGNISDHLPCRTIIPDRFIRKNASRQVTTRDTRKSKIIALKDALVNETWDIDENRDINESSNIFHNKLTRLVESHLPVITRNVSPHNFRREPWLNDGIMRCIQKYKKYYKATLLKSATEASICQYNDYRNVLNTIKRYSKLNYYQEKCTEFKRNMTRLWQLINNVITRTNDKSGIVESIKIGNLRVNDPKKIDNHFGEYFSIVGDKINKNNKTIFMEPTTQSELFKIINSLPSKRSSGYDGISNVLLKEIVPLIITLLFHKVYFRLNKIYKLAHHH